MCLILWVNTGLTFFLFDAVVVTPFEGEVRRVEMEAPGVRGDAGFREGLVIDGDGLLRFELSGVAGLEEEALGDCKVETFPNEAPLRDKLDEPAGDLRSSEGDEIDLDDIGPEREALRTSMRGDVDFTSLDGGMTLESREARLLGGVVIDDDAVEFEGASKLWRRLIWLELEGVLPSSSSASFRLARAAGEDDLRKLR